MDLIVLLHNLQCKDLTLIDWSRGEQWMLFPSNLNVSPTKSRETLGFKVNGTCHLLYSKEKQKQILKNAMRFQRQHQATSYHLQQRSTFRG